MTDQITAPTSAPEPAPIAIMGGGVVVFETSARSTPKLDAALAKAQGEFGPAVMTKVNTFFNDSKYADLFDVWEAARASLSKHGIALTQWPIHSGDTRLHLITRVAHDGEWMQARFSLPVDKLTAQGMGAATTYCKRFMLTAVTGIVGEADDDGNEASGTGKKGKKLPPMHAEAQAESDRQNAERRANGQQPLRKAVRTTKQWTDDAIQDLNHMTVYDDVSAWWEKNREAIEKLEVSSPANYERLSQVADDARASLNATRPQ